MVSGRESHIKEVVDVLRSLKYDWDGCGAPALDPKLIDAVEHALLEVDSRFYPMVYPVQDGRIDIEYPHVLISTLEPTRLTVFLHRTKKTYDVSIPSIETALPVIFTNLLKIN